MVVSEIGRVYTLDDNQLTIKPSTSNQSNIEIPGPKSNPLKFKKQLPERELIDHFTLLKG